MNQHMGKFLLATMMVGAMTVPTLASATTFTDITKADSWALMPINDAQASGLFTGDGDGNFRPLDPISRQETAVVFSRLLQATPLTDAPSSYSDVSASDWSFGYVEAMQKLGLLLGDNGQFRPNDNITREELASLAVRAAGKTDLSGKGANLTVDDKASVSDWAKDSVQAAMELGLIHVGGTNFEPQKPATREDVAVTAVAVQKLLASASTDTGSTPAPVSPEVLQAALADVNHATDSAQMQMALEANATALSLNMLANSDYSALADKKPVADFILTHRAFEGYADVKAIQYDFLLAVQTAKNSEAQVSHKEATDAAIVQFMNAVNSEALQVILEQNADLFSIRIGDGSDYAKLSNKLAVAKSLYSQRGLDMLTPAAISIAFDAAVKKEMAVEGL